MALYFYVFHRSLQKHKKTKIILKYTQHILETTQNCGVTKTPWIHTTSPSKGHTHEYGTEFYVIDITKNCKQLHNSHGISLNPNFTSGPGSVVSIATGYGMDGPGIEFRLGEIFRACPGRPWGPPSLLYDGYRVFPGGKEWLGHDAGPSPPSSAVVMNE